MTNPSPIELALLIHAALPQTQCTRCGYPDCMAYANAIAAGQAGINQCPPGGNEGIERLAALTGQATNPLNPANGTQSSRAVAVINEAWCIGCTLCLPACPTDAILGSNKLMHTVIEPYCTGCELCVAVCPVDCITLENVTGDRTGWAAWTQQQADQALVRYKFHSSLQPTLLTKKTEVAPELQQKTTPAIVKLTVIDAALAKSRAARQTQSSIKP